MNISVTPSAFTLSGPLVAGERVGVSVSGFAFAEGVAPALALSARFPAALLASVQLAPSPWGFADGLLEAAQSHFADAPWAADSRLEAVQGTDGSYDVWLVGEGYEPGDFDHGTTIAAATLSADGLALVMASGMPFAVEIVPVGSPVATRAGEWGGELDTATRATGAFMLTARADERRDAVLELVAGRESLARLSAPMLNSILCPRPPLAFPF